MVVCSFCRREIPRGTGKLYITSIGKQFWYCSLKCEKNMNMGRKPHTEKWVTSRKQ